MKTYYGLAPAFLRLGALALSAAVAGCGGAGTSVPSSMAGLGPASRSGVTPLKAPPVCTAVSITAKFNGTAIAAGSWIWFSSVFHPNNYVGRFHMADSHITFSEGSTNYDIKTPGSRISLHTKPGLHLNWAAKNDIWWLMVPNNTSGNDFLNAVAWQVPAPGLAGNESVTWSAKFYSKGTQQILWQWAAAVYSQLDNFPPNYNMIGAKPLDDNHYPPMNSDHAGTPENEKQYVIAGATGGGGGNYTGGYSSTLAFTPCAL